MAQTVIIIPARYGSSRFPGKPLAIVAGVTLLQRVWNIARAVQNVARVIVATDDPRIFSHVEAFGGQAMMTPHSCTNGTERAWAVVSQMTERPDVVINLQGDALLTPPWVVQRVVDEFRSDAAVQLVTPAVRLKLAQVQALEADRACGIAGGTLVTFDSNFDALYFSKSIIPYVRNRSSEIDLPIFQHIGLYGYRVPTLERYVNLPTGIFENAEQLEQLRALEHGIPIRIVLVDYRGRTQWSVDNPTDVEAAEKLIQAEGELV